MRSIICTAIVGILATVASANYESCSYKCALDYSTCLQGAKVADDYNDCALTLSGCQKGCVQLKSTFSVASKIKTFAVHSQHMAEFNGADTNGDGLISLEEFLTVVKYQQGGFYDEDFSTQAFRGADSNMDGFLTYEEIERANGEASLLAEPKPTWDCTYRCGVWNTCQVKGAWNGDTSKCGAEPSGCKCVW